MAGKGLRNRLLPIFQYLISAICNRCNRFSEFDGGRLRASSVTDVTDVTEIPYISLRVRARYGSNWKISYIGYIGYRLISGQPFQRAAVSIGGGL